MNFINHMTNHMLSLAKIEFFSELKPNFCLFYEENCPLKALLLGNRPKKFLFYENLMTFESTAYKMAWNS